jgi:hypothetical protein
LGHVWWNWRRRQQQELGEALKLMASKSYKRGRRRRSSEPNEAVVEIWRGGELHGGCWTGTSTASSTGVLDGELNMDRGRGTCRGPPRGGARWGHGRGARPVPSQRGAHALGLGREEQGKPARCQEWGGVREEERPRWRRTR